MNGAAQVLTNMRKFDRGMTHARRHDLHWLDGPDRVKYRLCVAVYKCLHGMPPQYLTDLCTPVAEVPGRQRLRSADRGQLQTPRYRLTTSGCRSFTCAVPSIWNALPDYLKDTALSLSYYAALLLKEGAAYCVALCLSVCLSVCLSIRPSVIVFVYFFLQ